MYDKRRFHYKLTPSLTFHFLQQLIQFVGYLLLSFKDSSVCRRMIVFPIIIRFSKNASQRFLDRLVGTLKTYVIWQA